MNCLLMRELSVWNIVRMWDTYLVRPSFLSSLLHEASWKPPLGARGGLSRSSLGSLSLRLLVPLLAQAEGGDAFSEFHLYVCLAFLVRWSDKLREMDFQVR